MEQCRLHVKKYPFSQHGIINYWNTFSECGNCEKIFTNATDIYFRQEGGYTNDGFLIGQTLPSALASFYGCGIFMTEVFLSL